jgi:hypothetical protein
MGHLQSFASIAEYLLVLIAGKLTTCFLGLVPVRYHAGFDPVYLGIIARKFKASLKRI